MHIFLGNLFCFLTYLIFFLSSKRWKNKRHCCFHFRLTQKNRDTQVIYVQHLYFVPTNQSDISNYTSLYVFLCFYSLCCCATDQFY